MDLFRSILENSQRASLPLVAALSFSTVIGAALLFYLALFIVAPVPRAPLKSEKTYRSAEEHGGTSDNIELPCWQDRAERQWRSVRRSIEETRSIYEIERAEVFMSLVVPAFNEEERLGLMLKEAVEYLQEAYGDSTPSALTNSNRTKRKEVTQGSSNGHVFPEKNDARGWEVLVVSDGSTDNTTETALEYAKTLNGSSVPGIRVIQLHENRGKGGAVTHGMRHVRGQYAIFADADGASKFQDLEKLVRACQEIEDVQSRGVAVGSRAHLVGSEAVVKRSFVRNLLMHSFHLLLRFLTPPATAAIRDTQCGFKLFSRASLPYIIPYMHSEGWIFDVEMLMLAESAGIPVVEVPIGWQEIKGSKLNVLWDSMGMAWGLAILRAAWGLGVYKRA
ncbi:dolichyl-phosphate beta-glucosyltransferase [Lecanora helva]